jgi:hypothetical protein
MMWKNQWWTTTLQERLNLESVVMEAIATEDAQGSDDDSGLHFGPYDVSPMTGLHFDTSEDTAAS